MYNTIQKTIAAWAFNHYVAYYYFDNVNVSQLKVAFERGEVELENLPIKKDALQHLNLPMDVVSGVVGKLSIKVPLMTLLTEPWLITIKDLMLIVAPRKTTNNANCNMTTLDDCSNIRINDLNHMQDASEINMAEQLENSTLEDDGNVNSEETKLAEFYSSFSSTVSSIVRDIYKNIKLEVESMTILFEDFDYGLVKFSVDNMLLHRPKSARNMVMDNVSLYLSTVGIPSLVEGDELIRINIGKCNLDIFDEASNNMQLVLVEQQKQPDSHQDSSSSTKSSNPASEIRIEGHFSDVSIERLYNTNRRRTDSSNSSSNSIPINGTTSENISMSKRNILKCDVLRMDFKLNNNVDDDTSKLSEKNLHLKLDLVGLQYIHSQRIYEMTSKCLMNLLKFFVRLQTKKKKNDRMQSKSNHERDTEDIIEGCKERSFNKLLVVNIEEGLLYIVDDTTGSCALPLLEFSLDNCRILQFSGEHQQNGFVFAKIGCSFYNREISTWETLLDPWPFSLSWDLKSSKKSSSRKTRIRQISLNSDEMANFVLSSAFLDLGDLALKRIYESFMHPKLWPLTKSLCYTVEPMSTDFNSIFVIRNETGHSLFFAPLECNSELFELNESSSSSPTMGVSGDTSHSPIHKLSINSRSSTNSGDSIDLSRLARWSTVPVGEALSFEFERQPVYRRYINDHNTQSRILLLQVEGWKTLTPIPVGKTGLFFRDAFSDRVMNEDTTIAIAIDLEKDSARKVITIRSPLNLVNELDATLEVHFVESKQALYIKPDTHLAVPLPYLYNQIHIRPCNVGVTMSEQVLLWDNIQRIREHESKIHVCHPITVTNRKHASYCTSHPYRICVSIKREKPQERDVVSDAEFLPEVSPPVYSINFISPLTLVNLLPCKIQYSIGDLDGCLTKGTQQRIYYADTTRSTDVQFKMHNFPHSKPITIDPGATGSFNHTLEMIDKMNRILYLKTKIVLTSLGEQPAVQVIVYASFWFINKTRLPLVFKQEGAALEAAGQFREHEEAAASILLFSFYDTEQEPPWLCNMRLGKSKGTSMWCDGFKLEKGSGERRICFMPNDHEKDSRLNKSLIDINIRRGPGKYSSTMIVTFKARYGFDPLTKTPKKISVPSPQNYKLTSYNHNANLAERIAGQAVSLFNSHQHSVNSDINFALCGMKLTLVDSSHERLLEASVKNVAIKCTTNAKEQILDCSIQDVRIENTLPDCEKNVVLDRALNLDESVNAKPAIRLIMDRILGNPFGTTTFRQVQLSMCELALNIEEKLVLKLVEFISFRNRRNNENINNLTQDMDRILHPEDDRMAKYYFDLLRIDLSSLNLSVFTSPNVTNSLQRLKSYLGLKFFGFEDAQVELAPYFKLNVSKTFRGVFESVTRFYKRQILEQAPRIVGQQIQNYLRFHLSDLLSTLYDEVYNKLFN